MRHEVCVLHLAERREITRVRWKARLHAVLMGTTRMLCRGSVRRMWQRAVRWGTLVDPAPSILYPVRYRTVLVYHDCART